MMLYAAVKRVHVKAATMSMRPDLLFFGTHALSFLLRCPCLSMLGSITAQNMPATHKHILRARLQVVHCCGYDSIPSDLGTLFMVDHIKRTLGKGVAKV